MIALVLAAGRGARMGGPKALLPWGGQPLLLAHAAAARAAGCARVLAVVRPEVAAALGPVAGAVLVTSREDESLGPSGSIKAAVRAEPSLAAGAELVAVNNVDAAPGSWGALAGLRAALCADVDALAAQPRFGERGGHPVLLRAALLARYLPPPATARDRDVVPTLRELLAAHAPRMLRIPVGVEATASDMDTPDEYARWRPGSDS